MEAIDLESSLTRAETSTTLRDAVRNGAPESEIILKVYEKGANRMDPIADEFIHDLDDIVALAEWGEQEGAKEITLEVNW